MCEMICQIQNDMSDPDAAREMICHKTLKELKKIVGSNPQMNACTHKLVSYSEDKLTGLGTAKCMAC